MISPSNQSGCKHAPWDISSRRAARPSHRLGRRIGQALLLLLCLGFLVSTPAAQAIIPDARDGRVGGQLLFYFDMVNHDVGYFTITNLGTIAIPVHIQLFGPEGESSIRAGAPGSETDPAAALVRAGREIARVPVLLTSSCTTIYDLRRFQLPNGLTVDLAGNKGFMMVTPVSTAPGNPALSYNHLAGSAVYANINKMNSFGLNAVARLAVDPSGNALPDNAGLLDGINRKFQNIQPAKLYNDGFFALDSVSDSRIILISWADNYSLTGYQLTCSPSKLNGQAGAGDCTRKTLAEQSLGCLTDLAMTTILGSHAGLFRQTPGFLEFNTTYTQNQNLVGIASQALGSYTAYRYLWGQM